MSSIVLEPPRIRFEVGQEMKDALRSTSVTSMVGSRIRIDLAAVAPPKPAPITTTRALVGDLVAQPAADSVAPAAATLRNCLLFTIASLLRGKVGCDEIDLLVGIALGELMHDRRRPRAVLKGLHLRHDVLLGQACQRNYVLSGAAALGAVAVGARSRKAARNRVFLRIGCKRQRNRHRSQQNARECHPWPPSNRELGDRGGLFLELEDDLLGLAEVDRDLAAVLQLAEQQLIGERPADGVLDKARHRAGAHQRVEALLRQVLLERLGEARLDLFLGQLLVEL